MHKPDKIIKNMKQMLKYRKNWLKPSKYLAKWFYSKKAELKRLLKFIDSKWLSKLI